MNHAVQVLDEHTGTTDDTHLLGDDGVPKRGFIVGVTLTRAGAAAGTVTIYDTELADGAGAYATEKVVLGPYEVQADTVANTPIHIPIREPVPFLLGIGADLSAIDLGVQIHWRS
jgi:hypothetical protein